MLKLICRKESSRRGVNNTYYIDCQPYSYSVPFSLIYKNLFAEDQHKFNLQCEYDMVFFDQRKSFLREG
jgi:hypothetical protein